MSISRSACAVLRRDAGRGSGAARLASTSRWYLESSSIPESKYGLESAQKRKISRLSVCRIRTGAHKIVGGRNETRLSILPVYGNTHSFSTSPRREDEKKSSEAESDISETSPTSNPSLSHLDPAELEIHSLLTSALQPTKIKVEDVSGGCGTMYSIEVYSEKFKGMNVLKQQRFVNSILGERVKGWHGVMIKTGVE